MLSAYEYDTLVKSAYLRHVLVETEAMADLVASLYLNGGRFDGADDDDGSTSEDEGGDVLTAGRSDGSTIPVTSGPTVTRASRTKL